MEQQLQFVRIDHTVWQECTFEKNNPVRQEGISEGVELIKRVVERM